MRYKWGTLFPETEDSTIECFTEYTDDEGTVYCVHPNFRSEGPWYNWALVRWHEGGKRASTDDFPCRVLFFFQQIGADESSSLGNENSLSKDAGSLYDPSSNSSNNNQKGDVIAVVE
jgi:hypothetical protein